MEQLLQVITDLNGKVNDFVWGPPMLIVFLLVGLYFTVRTKVFQITKFKLWISTTFLACFRNKKVLKTDDSKSISQFQSLCTALAATIGTGNIAGVATALVLGGPGAIFWMWLSAFLGMMTNYAENVLGIHYRYKNEKGDWIGGPMIYIEKGLKWKWLAVIFSCFCVLASFGIGNMSQANSISTALHDSFGIPLIVTGIAIAAFVALVIMGGIKRIASVTEKIVPFMAGIYIVGALIVIGINIANVPGVFAMIFREAFRFEAAAGGLVGFGLMKAMRRGISRGVFSNEAGLGSSVMVHSASDVKEPVVQGMWGVFEVFADTIIVCTITAVTILSSGAYDTTEYIHYNAQNDLNTSYISEGEGQIASISETGESDIISSALMIADQAIEDIYKAAQDVNGENVAPDGLYGLEGIIGTFEAATVKVFDKNGILDTAMVSSAFAAYQEEKLETIKHLDTKKTGVPLTSSAFESVFGTAGKMFVSIAVMLFAFSTLLGWSYYGERGIEYLFGLKAVPIYKVIFIVIVVFGCVAKVDLVWDLSDTFNGLMAMPNLLAVMLLSGTVLRITKDYMERRKKGLITEE